MRVLPLAAVMVLTIGIAAPAAAAPTTKRVEYRGVAVRVPADWPVVDLAAHPGTCARVDRHAVYLGTPGESAACPPRVFGRTETIGLRPTTTAPAEDAVRLPRTVPDTASRGASWALRAAGVTMTVTYGAEPEAIDAILASATITESARPASTPRVATPNVFTPVPGRATGYGFDACQAPSSTTMDAWLGNSSFRSIGVYIGGGDLGCPDQPYLSPNWVARQSGKGWHIFPLYVGRQAPCSNQPYKITVGKAPTQGKQDADDAIAQARKYGMAQNSIIINDMEYYDRGGTCSAVVLNYLSAWTAELNAGYYRSGVYSSRAAAIDDLVDARPSGKYHMPGTLDFAQWDEKATTANANIPSDWWVHHRIKQYRGAHNEKHGGVTINIDSDYLDVS